VKGFLFVCWSPKVGAAPGWRRLREQLDTSGRIAILHFFFSPCPVFFEGSLGEFGAWKREKTNSGPRSEAGAGEEGER